MHFFLFNCNIQQVEDLSVAVQKHPAAFSKSAMTPPPARLHAPP